MPPRDAFKLAVSRDYTGFIVHFSPFFFGGRVAEVRDANVSLLLGSSVTLSVSFRHLLNKNKRLAGYEINLYVMSARHPLPVREANRSHGYLP